MIAVWGETGILRLISCAAALLLTVQPIAAVRSNGDVLSRLIPPEELRRPSNLFQYFDQVRTPICPLLKWDSEMTNGSGL